MNNSKYNMAEKAERLDDFRLSMIGPFVWSIGLAILAFYAATCRPLDSFTFAKPPPQVSAAPGVWPSIIDAWRDLSEGDPTLKALPHRQSLLWLGFAHWLPIGALVLMILIVMGRLGGGLGLPGLFRDPPRADVAAELKRRREVSGYTYGRGHLTAFLGAMGATFLIAEVWSVIFYLEVVENFEDLGLCYFEGNGGETPFTRHRDLLSFLIKCCSPWLVLLLLAGVFPSRAPGIERRGVEFRKGSLKFVLGVLAGSGFILLAVWVGSSLHGIFEQLWLRLIYPAIDNLSRLIGSRPLLKIQFLHQDLLAAKTSGKPDIRHALIVMGSFSSFFATALLFFPSLALLRRSLSPGLAICMLLGWAVLIYAFLAMLSALGQVLTLSVVFLWLVFANGDKYKYRLPGMDSYYRDGCLVTQQALDKAIDPAVEGEDSGDGTSRLRNVKVLENWKSTASKPGEGLPKLIMVATTGGAYRAAFWTTVVLDELGRVAGDDFSPSIRLFTGASGGMVGAAYFVSKYEKGKPPSSSVTELMREETGLDSLTPVVRRLVLGDLPLSLWPFPQSHDRGIVLEREWKSLAKTFPKLGEGEKAGWRPSLIVSPMVVESGRRLLISNLDLSQLAETRPLGTELVSESSSHAAELPRLYSCSAVEFFRVFPEARDDFSLQTAIRMSATFPLASPAVSLPTDPPRRVVDAGYYDNYGVDLATSWAYQYQDWLLNNTSGVALIQLRAYPSENDIRTYFGLAGATHRGLVDRILDRVAVSLQGLTSPLYGGMSAREGSMKFRNASQVRILDDVFNRKKRGFFETFVFENYADFAMNWFISEQDIASMKQSIGAPPYVKTSPTVDEGAVDAVVPEGPARNAIKAARIMCIGNNVEMKNSFTKWWNRV